MNQTKLHYELTRRTAGWLGKYTTGRGLQWMQEFTLLNGIRLDAVAFCDLQQGFYQRFTENIVDWIKLEHETNRVRRNHIFKLKSAVRDGKSPNGVKKAWAEANKEILDRYGLPENRFMFAFETKVTYSDFNSTFKNDNHTGTRLEPFANFHFLVTPKDFHRAPNLACLPKFWGILEKSGRGLSIVRMPIYEPMGELEFYKNAYNLLFRKGKYRLTDDAEVQNYKEESNI